MLSTRNVVTKSSKSRKSLNSRITRRLTFKRYFKLPRVIQANLPFAEFANSPSTIRSIIDCAFFIFPRGLCTGLDPRIPWLRGRQRLVPAVAHARSSRHASFYLLFLFPIKRNAMGWYVCRDVPWRKM